MPVAPQRLERIARIDRELEALGRVFRGAVAVAFAAQLGCSTKDAADPVDASVIDGAPSGHKDAGREASADAACDPTDFTPNPPDTCGDYVRFPCGLPAGVVPRDDCYLTLPDCAAICPDIHFNCHLADNYCPDGGGAPIADDAGAMVIDCAICPTGAGRMPRGLVVPPRRFARSELGAYFARAAHFEAASVHAFRALREQLARHDAPMELVEGARAAERDEVRHTRSMARLARRFGGRYVSPRVARSSRTPSLEEIATENAIEGCVRETMGAIELGVQAVRAADPEVAATLHAVARDELAHAALSWAIARWAHARLDPAARERIASACRIAVAELATEAPYASSADASARLGSPTSTERAAMIAELSRTLWTDLATDLATAA